MQGNWMVLAAAVAFVGTHFLLSHPLRQPIVGAIGARGFLILYSLVAFATLGWLIIAYRAAPYSLLFWPVDGMLWAIVSAVMLLASVLLIGSLIDNPAFPDPDGTPSVPAEASGVFAITRHPMLWSFALWGLCHIAVYPVPANIIVAVSIIVLSLVGAALQDRKKERLFPDKWPEWESRTSFWPFGAVTAGRARIGMLSLPTLVGGVILWLVATWAHIPLAGFAAGIWQWII